MPVHADTVEIFLPASDARQVQTPQARIVDSVDAGGWRRLTLQLLA